MRSTPCIHRLGPPWLGIALLGIVLAGCATGEKWIERRPENTSFSAALGFDANEPLALSASTDRVARSTGLDPNDPQSHEQLHELLELRSETKHLAEVEFALCELASNQADQRVGSAPDKAIGFYAESLIHGYRALSGDPRHRIMGVTDRYNRSLASLLRLLREQNQVRPGAQVSLPTDHEVCSIAIELHSKRWTEQDFQGFEFADDYQVLGLRNHFHTSGVGVPLIAIRYHPDRESPQDRYYPRKLCYPLTAFVRAESTPSAVAGQPSAVRLVLELHDPTDHETIRVAGQPLPMQSDLTTPLAYYLDQPELHEEGVSTLGLFQPGSVEQLQGLYLLEPFDPSRIPVVMVHGLWSSPATWMEMFNDLRSDPALRSRYQFWFYLYPTGSPFWVSAAQMRTDLASARATFDPNRTMPALDQTVLVGHSMGGLVSRLQTVDSGDDFWNIVTDRKFLELNASSEAKQYVSSLFYFQPNPSVRRVVTIGTPHRGSRFANGFTKWLGAKLIAFPMTTLAKRQELFRQNPGFFRPHVATRVMTSIDSLSPESPMLSTLLAAKPAPWVNYHNIVGDEPRSGFTGWLAPRGDGVVSIDSARLDDLPRLASQVTVPEEHVMIHRHPQSITEVRRVLHQQLRELSQLGNKPSSLTEHSPYTTGIQLVSGEAPSPKTQPLPLARGH